MTSRHDDRDPTGASAPFDGAESGIVLPAGLAEREAAVLGMIDGLESIDPPVMALLQAPGPRVSRLWLAARCIAGAAARPGRPSVSDGIRARLVAALADELLAIWAADGLLLMGAEWALTDRLAVEPAGKGRLALLDSVRRARRGSVELVRACARLMTDLDARVRVAVVRMIGRYQAVDAGLAALIRDALDDPDPAVRQAAIAVAGSLQPIDEEDLERVRAAAQDDVPGVRAAALRVLVAQTAPDDGLLDGLIEAASDESGTVRAVAIGGLGRPAVAMPTLAMPWLLEQIGAEGADADAARKALTAAARSGVAVAPFLVDALLDGPWPARAPAAELLGRIGTDDQAVVEALLASCESGSELVRAAAALAGLGRLPTAEIALLAMACQDREDDVRYVAAEALEQLVATDGDAAECLVAALGGRESKAAATVLARLAAKHPRLLELLVRALGDERPPVRFGASSIVLKAGQSDPAGLAILLRRALDGQFGQVDASLVWGLLRQTEALSEGDEQRSGVVADDDGLSTLVDATGGDDDEHV